MTRRLVVVRHGETGDNRAGIWQGQRDTALNELGRQQAYAAAPVLAAYHPRVIVTSPLQRASVTADAIAAVAGVPVEQDPRLAEINVGRWSGRTRAQVREDDPDLLEALERGEDIPRGRTGETLVQVGERAGAALRSIAAALPEDGVAIVVCHGVSGRSGIADLVGLDQQYAMGLLASLGNCHWACAGQMRRGGWRIESWNERVTTAAGSGDPRP